MIKPLHVMETYFGRTLFRVCSTGTILQGLKMDGSFLVFLKVIEEVWLPNASGS